MFPELSLEWDFPSYLTSTIVEIGDYWTEKEIILILDSLREVNCFHFQIYSSSIQRLEFYDIFLKKANKYPFRSIELVIPYYLDIEKDIEAFTSKNCILKHVLIYNSPMEKIISNSGTEDKCFFINQNLNLAGYIDYGYFQVNIDLFSESQKHHTFFNRKAIITKDLNVKNHLLQQEVFGNLKEQSLYQMSVLQKSGKVVKKWSSN